MTTSSNPLRQFFRQPAIYVRLPSGGQFWPPGSLDMPQNGELPVFPMTAVDEITYRTPDALFNGQAVIDVVQSCVPGIKNAWHMPSIDVNAILVAIRIASYGHEMDIATTCPSCETEADFALDLRSVLAQLDCPDYSKTLTHGDLEISFHPLSYESQNKSGLEQFETQQHLRSVTDGEGTDEEKVKRMAEIMKAVTLMTINALTYAISAIRTPTVMVTEPDLIREFLQNCDRTVFAQIRDHAITLRSDADIQPLDIKCNNCQHQYKQGLTLDMTSFFVRAS